VPLRVALAAIAVLLLASACGGKSERRDAVVAYIREVNAVQNTMRRPLLQVVRAYRDFGRKGGPSLEKLEPRLARSETTIRAVDRRLKRLTPPPDARELHVLLVRLVGSEAQVAREVVQLARFAPRFSAALTPLAPASKKLRGSFTSATKARDQADALDAYSAALATVLVRLRPLEAPPAFAPALAGQRSTLTRVRTSALALSAGLRANKRAALPTLIERFTNAGLASQSLSAQRARIAAIEGYNSRVKQLDALARKVDRERLRLEKDLA
jgi:hypothetical protein